METKTNSEKYIYYMIDIFDTEPTEELIIAKNDNEVIEYYEKVKEDRYGYNDTKMILYFDIERAKSDYLTGIENTEHYNTENDYDTEVRYLVKKIPVSELNNLNCMDIFDFFDIKEQLVHNS